MMRFGPWLLGFVLVAGVLGLGALIANRLIASEPAGATRSGPTAIPVEVAPVERGVIEDRRVFSGALEASAEVTIAPKVAGRVFHLPLDLADVVRRGDIVAQLDGAEFEQSVVQAEAELAVAKAVVVEAENGAQIALRALERVETLFERGVASESQLDTVRADHLSKDAAVEVAKAQVMRAEAALQAARIRLSYTTIRAEWVGGDEQRVVAQRFIEEGDTISANTPLLTIIDLNPIDAVMFATERDYALLTPNQPVTLTTDAYPTRRWEGRITRVSPVFREGTRQARIEIRVPNEDGALKPGMFARIEAILARDVSATIVPLGALVDRGGQPVVFLIAEDGESVRMKPVATGIRDGQRVQVFGEEIEGHVVTLGQQLLGDQSAVTIRHRSDGDADRGTAPEAANE